MVAVLSPEQFDMVVIGAGPAGEKGAAQAAYFGKRVAIVERSARAGGAAALNAWVPSKTLREAALYLTGFRHRGVYDGLSLDLDPTFTLLDSRARLVPVMDHDVSDGLATALRDAGVRVVLEAGRANVSRDAEGLAIEVTGHDVLRPDKVLFAAGRAGNTEGLALEDAGVESDGYGRIKVDDCYRTSAAGIYAAGDVIGPPALASV